MYLGESAQSGFYCPGLLYGLVVMIFERQVGVHPDSPASSRLCIESDETVPYLNCVYEFRPEVLLVAFPACEQCGLRLCGVKLEISSAGLLNVLGCAGLKLFDHLVHILPSCHPSEVVYEGEAFGLDSLVPPTVSVQRCVSQRESAILVSIAGHLLPRGDSVIHCLRLRSPPFSLRESSLSIVSDLHLTSWPALHGLAVLSLRLGMLL